MNLKPRVSSNFSAALISPKLPSLIKSGKLNLGLVLLGHRYNETQIGTCQLLQCDTVTLADALSELYLLLDSYEVFATDFLQILVKRSALC